MVNKTGTGNRRSKRSTKTREAILDAAGRVLSEHGYEGTSMELVAAEAGITKGTVYYHFDAKEAIYAGVVLRYLDGALKRLDDAVASEPTVEAALERVIDDQIDDTISPSHRYVHYQEILSVGDEIHAAVRAAQRRYERRLAEILAEAQRFGFVRSGDPHLLSMLLIGSIGRTSRWYRQGGRIPESAFRDTLKQFILHGLLETMPER